MHTTRTRFLILLFVSIAAGVGAYTTHAAYSPADVSQSGGGGLLYQPHCGPGGSSVSGGYLDGSPSAYPAGFWDNPTHYCFWETEKVINNFKGSIGYDTVNNWGWQVFPGDFTGSGVQGDSCGEASWVRPHDLCWNTHFTVAPPTASLSAAPATVTGGQPATLTWSSTHATSCDGSGFFTGGATAGSITVTPGATQTYSVTCSGGGGSANASATVTVTQTPQQPTVTFVASPSTVTTGAAALLSWSSTNATSCTGTGFSTGGATAGSVSTGPLSQSRAYLIQCSGPGGVANGSAAVTVNSPQPGQTADLSASPATITQGQSTTLTYTCSPAAPANIIPTVGTLTPTPVSSGSVRVSPSSTTTYTLNCFGNFAVVSSSATVTVVPPVTAPTARLSASPTTVASGNASTLSWSSTNATSCVGTGFTTGNTTGGSESTGPLSAPASYGLTCTGPGGSVTAVPVTVDVTGGVVLPPPGNGGGGPPAPVCSAPSVNLTSTPTRVRSGHSVTLTVTGTGVGTACTLSGPGVTRTFTANSCDVNGTFLTPPLTTQSVYTVSCDGGAATGRVIVNVNPWFAIF